MARKRVVEAPSLHSWEDVNDALRQIAEAQIALGEIQSDIHFAAMTFFTATSRSMHSAIVIASIFGLVLLRRNDLDIIRRIA